MTLIALMSTRIDPSHKAAINGSKRGQEGITNEAIFLYWKFPIVKPNFAIFSMKYFKHIT